MLDIAPLSDEISRDFTALPAHPHVYPPMEWTMPVFAFPAEAGPQLLTLEKWTAELA